MFDEQLKVCIKQKQATVVALNLLVLLKKKTSTISSEGGFRIHIRYSKSRKPWSSSLCTSALMPQYRLWLTNCARSASFQRKQRTRCTVIWYNTKHWCPHKHKVFGLMILKKNVLTQISPS